MKRTLRELLRTRINHGFILFTAEVAGQVWKHGFEETLPKSVAFAISRFLREPSNHLTGCYIFLYGKYIL